MASDGEWYPQKWEYDGFRWWDKSLNKLADTMVKHLAGRGQQGWELVSSSMIAVPASGGVDYTVFGFLKRPLKP
jgi:hypothetical protein